MFKKKKQKNKNIDSINSERCHSFSVGHRFRLEEDEEEEEKKIHWPILWMESFYYWIKELKNDKSVLTREMENRKMYVQTKYAEPMQQTLMK